MTIPHPEGKQTAAILGGWSFVVPKSAKNPDEAKTFVQFLNTSREPGLLTDTFPARTSVDGAAALRRPDPRSSSSEMLPYGRPVPVHKNWVQITQAYFDGIQRILLGDEDRADGDGRGQRGDPGAARNSHLLGRRPSSWTGPGLTGAAGASAVRSNTGLVFALPALIVLFMLIAYPVAYTGLAERDERSGPVHGAAELLRRAASRVTTQAFWNTLWWVGGSIVFQVVLGVAAAILLNQNFVGRALVRSITLIPWVIPGIVAATTWAWMFHTEFGIINYMLTSTGALDEPVGWLTNARHGDAGADRHQRLEALPLRRDHGACRAAVDPAGALRGRARRRRQLSGTRFATSCCRRCGRSSPPSRCCW